MPPYVGEIRLFAGNFGPNGWMTCQGQQLPISEYDTLFTLIGTTYGGDGQETFNLPDLQGRVPVHMGQGPGIAQAYQLGDKAGVETVTLNTQQIPGHNHSFFASTAGGSDASPENALLASPPSVTMFLSSTPTQTLAPASVLSSGGSQPHDNLMPVVALQYIISLFGVFPHQ
jgi:microcystin-dependent protein